MFFNILKFPLDNNILTLIFNKIKFVSRHLACLNIFPRPRRLSRSSRWWSRSSRRAATGTRCSQILAAPKARNEGGSNPENAKLCEFVFQRIQRIDCLMWVRVNCSNLDCSTIFSKMSSARQTKLCRTCTTFRFRAVDKIFVTVKNKSSIFFI